MSRVRNVSRQLLQELGREPTLEETARRAETTVEEARRVLAMSRYPIVLLEIAKTVNLAICFPMVTLKLQPPVLHRKCCGIGSTEYSNHSAIVNVKLSNCDMD